jgi:hypothetical protein
MNGRLRIAFFHGLSGSHLSDEKADLCFDGKGLVSGQRMRDVSELNFAWQDLPQTWGAIATDGQLPLFLTKEGGEGWGEEVFNRLKHQSGRRAQSVKNQKPLSPALSPFVPHGARVTINCNHTLRRVGLLRVAVSRSARIQMSGNPG